jgi:hypothetical protein
LPGFVRVVLDRYLAAHEMNFPRDTIRSFTFVNIINPRDLRDLSIKLTGAPAFLGLTFSFDTSASLIKAFGVARAARTVQSSLQFPFMQPGLSGLFEGLLIRETYQAGSLLTREREDGDPRINPYSLFPNL